MKKLLITLALLFIPLAGAAAAVQPASAVNVFQPCNGAAAGTDVCKSIPNPGKPGTNPIISTIKVAITILAVIIGVASVIVIIIAGFTMVTSGGSSEDVANARRRIIYALVGIVVAVLAETMVEFVLSKF